MARDATSLVRRIGLALLITALVLRRPLRAVILAMGGIALLMLLLSFTRLPWELHRWLGTATGPCGPQTPRVVLVLGGSGMPSGPELLRLHHAAEWARRFPQAAVVVVHPQDTTVMRDMLAELRLRGVADHRLIPVLEGTNTREQAITVMEKVPVFATLPMALVTAPENTYRSVRTFRKAGFMQVCGAPAWDTPMFIDLAYDHRRVGGKAYAPDVSGSNALRYDLWNRLKLQVTCLRELLAIGYYRINGWI